MTLAGGLGDQGLSYRTRRNDLGGAKLRTALACFELPIYYATKKTGVQGWTVVRIHDRHWLDYDAVKAASDAAAQVYFVPWSFYFTRFHTSSAFPPPDAAVLVYFISSPVIVTIRF
jgi:hypothetical protein